MQYLREDLSRIDESWVAARFDSLPHVVHILTSKDRDAAAQFLKEQSDIIEDVVDEVVHSYHSGFNRAIQNYSQILKLFSESTESISVLKVDLSEAKKRLSARNKQLHQLWYRSVTLRHIISLLDQIEDIAKVPARIEKLITEKQFYAAIQLHVQSILMLERGLQNVGALQDVRSDLTKLRGVLFFKVLEDLHAHLYNKGEYSVAGSTLLENDDEVPTTTAVALAAHNSQPLSRRTRLLKGDSQNSLQIDGSYRPGSVDGGSFDGHDEADSNEETTRINGSDVPKDSNNALHQMPTWLLNSTPDEFLETIRKSDAPLHVKYLQTMVECLCMLGKVAAAGAIICQRLRPTIHEIITSKIKAHAELLNSTRSSIGQGSQAGTGNLHFIKGQLESYQLPKQKRKNGISISGTLLAVSPVSPLMAPGGKAQVAAKELLDSILDAVVRIFENHVIVGELLEAKASQHAEMNTPKSLPVDINWNPDSEASQVTGGYSIGFSLTVLQSECQQLICEILRATPEAASADAAVQTARLASKVPSKNKKDGSEDGLTFAFRFTDAIISIPNQGVDLVRQGWNRKGPNVLQEGYGSAAVLPEEGIYLAASIYRPVIQFTDKLASMLPTKYSQLGNDGLQAFVENFVKDHFLPTMFVDYRKGVQQAISSKSLYCSFCISYLSTRLGSYFGLLCILIIFFETSRVLKLALSEMFDVNAYSQLKVLLTITCPAAFRPRAHVATTYTPSIEKGRPVLQGLLAIDHLTKEVLGWAQAMPKFANDLVKYVQTFLERTYERCRTAYMEAVLEKQSYMLIGRHDIEKLMRLEPSSVYLPNPLGQSNVESNSSDAETIEAELELMTVACLFQENLIHDDNKLILLASLSDSLEYANLLNIQVPGREIPPDAQDRVSDILSM
uniref:Exocyst complex component Sec8 n=1 Tax=Cajanus cajan TaxID=3821 RepID=A0A151SE51_CAJCA|nr:putative exocyst complex component 4 [Cajanus cajan]